MLGYFFSLVLNDSINLLGHFLCPYDWWFHLPGHFEISLYAEVSILWTFTLHSCAFIYHLCGSLINHVNQCEKKSLKEICHFTRFDNEESSYIWMISRLQDLWPLDRGSNDVCSDVCTTKFCIISNLFYVSHVHVVERSIQPPPCRYFICRGWNLSLDRSKVGVSIST